MARTEDARDTALELLLAYQRRDAYINTLLPGSLERSGLDRRDRALVTELVQGTVRMLRTLDWALSLHSKRELLSLDPEVLWILRLACYQLLFMDTPDYAAVDTGASLARSHSGEGAVAFVNAVLRALARGRGSLPWPDRATDPESYLEVRYSHPRWVVDMWVRELGLEKTESLCSAGNTPQPVSLRCNLAKVSREAVSATLAGAGAAVTLSDIVPEGLLLKGGGSIAELEEYRSGLFAVQDQGAILVGHAVDPEPGMSVLDVCAAPGGKANHLAELMGNEGRVVAIDVSPARLALVEQSARRLGNTILTTRAMDATNASVAFGEKFDRVLVDAPCSGLGTLARRPDIRWRKSEADIEGLRLLQSELLADASKLVAPGGLLVYSTCTISERENERVVEEFMACEHGFEPAPAGVLESLGGGRYFVQLLPDTHGCDGTFIARMRRS